MKKLLFLLLICTSAYAQTFRVRIDPSLHTADFDGRLLLLLSKNDKAEPRFQVGDGTGTQLVFGEDVEGWN